MIISKRKFGEEAPEPSAQQLFGEELRRLGAEEADDFRSLREYARLVPEPKSGAVDLVQFPYQIEPMYDDVVADAPEAVVMKSTQVGVTTGLWRWAVRRADQFGETVIYYFPTDVHVTDFSDTRIEPAIEASEYLRGRIPQDHVRQKKLKHIGAGWVSLRGVQSKNSVQSVDADALVFDEYDECDPRNLEQAERRLSGAKAAGRTPRIRRIGRPSIPGYGIDVEYQRSDMRRWLVTCPKCKDEQPLEFAENLRWKSAATGSDVLRAGKDVYEEEDDVTAAWRACRSCGTSLEPRKGKDVGPIHAGRWVPQRKKPGAIPGFHMPRMIVPRTDLEEIVKASRGTKPHEIESFFNADLGIPYAATDSVLTDEQLDLHIAEGGEEMAGYSGRFHVTAGIDVASERDMTMRISEMAWDGRRRAIWMGEPEDFQEVEELLKRFRVTVAVVDSMPERRSARALAAAIPGRVYLAIYDEKPTADAFRYDDKKNLIHVNRTEAIDAMMDGVRGLHAPPLASPPVNYRAQMKSPVRRIVEDTKGRPRRVYVSTGSQGDDWAHAEVYDLVAEEMLGALTAAGAIADAGAETDITEGSVEGQPARLGYGAVDYDPGFGGRR